MGEFTLKGLQNRSLAARVVRGGFDFHALPPSPFTRGRQIPGTPPSEQFREARYRMLGLQFKDYEDEIRQHLSGMLPKDLFEFGEDVESITINRWAHGYAWWGSALHDSDLYDMAVKGRQPFGRITIANCDATLNAYAHVAIDQAWRAIKELG